MAVAQRRQFGVSEEIKREREEALNLKFENEEYEEEKKCLMIYYPQSTIYDRFRQQSTGKDDEEARYADFLPMASS